MYAFSPCTIRAPVAHAQCLCTPVLHNALKNTGMPDPLLGLKVHHTMETRPQVPIPNFALRYKAETWCLLLQKNSDLIFPNRQSNGRHRHQKQRRLAPNISACLYLDGWDRLNKMPKSVWPFPRPRTWPLGNFILYNAIRCYFVQTTGGLPLQSSELPATLAFHHPFHVCTSPYAARATARCAPKWNLTGIMCTSILCPPQHTCIFR